MECKLLLSKFKNETTIARVQEKLHEISGDHLVHCTAAFKRGLRTALDQKKPDPEADIGEGVMLPSPSPRLSLAEFFHALVTVAHPYHW